MLAGDQPSHSLLAPLDWGRQATTLPRQLQSTRRGAGGQGRGPLKGAAGQDISGQGRLARAHDHGPLLRGQRHVSRVFHLHAQYTRGEPGLDPGTG